jgi:hypothetical protein
VSLALEPDGPWDKDLQNFLVRCQDFPDTSSKGEHQGAFIDLFGSGGQGYKLKLRYTDGNPTQLICNLQIQGSILADVDLSSSDSTEILNKARTCRSELVAYATAFIALHPVPKGGEIDTVGCPELSPN